MAKKPTLPEIKSFPDHNCSRCELFNTTNNVCIGFYGNKSKVMVVGEAPGEAEERTGKPFQGRSGQLLTKLLLEAGIDREKIYITNTVLCRPPDNRAPKASEIKACAGYLQYQLDTINPEHVLLLGATALKGVLGKSGITELHGSIIKKDGREYLPTFHPAAALRDTKRLGPLKMDILKFGKLISNSLGSKPKLNIKLVTEWSDELLEDIQRNQVIVIDIETTSLNRFAPNSRVNYIGIGTQTTQWELKIPSWRGNVSQFLKYVRKYSLGKEIVMQNGKFDNLWLERFHKIKFKISFDTIIAAHLLDENSALSLKYLSKVYCKAHDYDINEKTKTQIGPETEEYLGYDLFYTRRLYYYLKKKLQEDEVLWNLFNHLSMPVVRAYERIEANGVYVNINQFKVVEKELHEERDKRLAILKKHADINWNSTDQVSEVLYSRMKLPVFKRTPGGKPSTDEATLLQLARKYKIAQHLLDFRETEKLVSTYVNGWQKRLKNESWLFPSFKTTGTVSGRPSCVDPNIQQTPRNKIIRSLVDAPDGWVMFEADQSQVELRITAEVSSDPALIYAYNNRIDVHALTASEVMEKPIDQVTEEERKMAKAVNFGLIYGMSAFKFQSYCFEKYGIIISMKESETFCEKFFNKYDLKPWHRRQKLLVAAAGQVRTLTGRIRHLPDVFSPDKKLRSQAERQAINSPVQGFAAELILMAIVEVLNEYDDDTVQIFGTVHDSILGRYRRGMDDKILPKIKKIMEHPKIMDILGIKLSIPLEVDIKIGPWGKGKKF